MDVTRRISAEEYRNMLSGAGSIEQSFRNRQSNDRGMAFEKMLIRGCEYYMDKRKAIITKVPEPYRCIAKLDGWFKGVFTRKAEPDFKGALRDGRAIAFEAKSTADTLIRRNVLTDRQMRMLDMQDQIGAAAYVCVNIQSRYFTIPWRRWRDMKSYYTRQYLTAEDITEYEVKSDELNEYVRFLEYVNGSVVR